MSAPAVRLLVAPYDSGARDVRMGAGPLALLRAGAAARLAAGRLPAVSAPLASWHPALDRDGRMRRTALDLLEEVAGLAGPAPGARAGRAGRERA
ncbi:hypothetical protein [Geodermatophilus sp. SYSU D00815]